jgi:hypothetical protein
MNKILIILGLLLSFNTFGDECTGTPVLRGSKIFCYQALPKDYATLDEVNVKYGEGPTFPGWDKGMITQLREAMDEVLDKNHEKAVEILSEVYAQNEFLILLEKKWSKRRLLKKARDPMEDAIFHLKTFWPRKGKLRVLIKKAIHQIERYTMKR